MSFVEGDTYFQQSYDLTRIYNIQSAMIYFTLKIIL